jgi:hypothetical protein
VTAYLIKIRYIWASKNSYCIVNFMNRRIVFLLSLLLCGLNATYAQYAGIKFYVVAHGEDWQTFMGNSAYHDIVQHGHDSANKVVIINITAGNWFTGYLSGCCKDICPGTNYWDATERAEQNSVDFAVNLNNHRAYSGTHSIRSVRGHNIRTYTNQNVTVYFLNLDENGLDKWYKSKGITGGLFAADGTATYPDYYDLVMTIAGIYRHEMHGGNFTNTSPDINTFDYEQGFNPADHDMHYFSGALAADGVFYYCHIVPFSIKLYQGLNLSIMPPNLRDDEANHDVQDKSGLYGVYSLGMLDDNAQVLWGDFPTWGYNATTDFLEKEYFRSYAQTSGEYCSRKVAGTANHLPGGFPTDKSVKTIDETNDRIEAKGADVYPNPVSDDLSFIFTGKYTASLHFRVIDVNGKIVFNEENVAVSSINDYGINTSAIVNGVYLLLITEGTNVVFKKNLVVLHSTH